MSTRLLAVVRGVHIRVKGLAWATVQLPASGLDSIFHSKLLRFHLLSQYHHLARDGFSADQVGFEIGLKRGSQRVRVAVGDG